MPGEIGPNLTTLGVELPHRLAVESTHGMLDDAPGILPSLLGGNGGGDDDRPVFIVLVDETEEMPRALRFASNLCRGVGGRVVLFYVTKRTEVQQWAGIQERIEEEQRGQAEQCLRELADHVLEWTGVVPSMVIRSGEAHEELLALAEEYTRAVLVLASSQQGDTAGPVISFLTGKGRSRLKVPVVVVPGSVSEEDLPTWF